MKGKSGESTGIVLRDDIYQSNPLIQARKDFDIIGMRIFFLGLCGINPHFSEEDALCDDDFKTLFIPTCKLTEAFGGNTKYLSELKRASKKLFKAIVELNYEDGGFKLMHIFEELCYRPKEGLYLQFSRKMQPYILDLFESKGYTRLNVKYLFRLSSPYAVRLLELMLQYRNIKIFKATQEIKRRLTLEELRFALNVPEGAYQARINNFRRFVLDDPIREINSRTPYILRYDAIKEGRRVAAFDFTMDTFNVPVEEAVGHAQNFSNDATELLCSMGFSDKVAQTIFRRCCDVQDCLSRINRAKALLERQTKPVKNESGFLRKAIEENWQINVKPATRKEPSGTLQKLDLLNGDTPVTRPRDLRIGRKKMPYSAAKTYIRAIREGQHLEIVNDVMKEFDTTIAEFEELCIKRGL